MCTNKIGIFSTSSGVLATVGENIKLARIGRRLTVYKVSKMAGISRSTLWQVEKGSPKVAIGLYYEVLSVRKNKYEKDTVSFLEDPIGKK